MLNLRLAVVASTRTNAAAHQRLERDRESVGPASGCRSASGYGPRHAHFFVVAVTRLTIVAVTRLTIVGAAEYQRRVSCGIEARVPDLTGTECRSVGDNCPEDRSGSQ